MDAKNLAVLMQLKQTIEGQSQPKPVASGKFSERALQILQELAASISSGSSSEVKDKTSRNRSAGPTSNRSESKPRKPNRDLRNSPEKSNNQVLGSNLKAKQSRKSNNICVFRGVPVSGKFYKALKESMAHMIYGNDEKLLKRKQEALAFYLSKAPEDRDARLIYEKVCALVQAGPNNRFVPSAEKSKREAWIRSDVAQLARSTGAPEDGSADSSSKWTKKICHWCEKEFVIHKDWVNPPTRCQACREKLRNTRVTTGKGGKTHFKSFVIVSGGAPGLGKRH